MDKIEDVVQKCGKMLKLEPAGNEDVFIGMTEDYLEVRFEPGGKVSISK